MKTTQLSGDHPALRNFTDVMMLSGFSGATVALVRGNSHQFVRKVSNLSNDDANAALRDQASRQISLKEVLRDCAALPEVIDVGDIDGFAYFDMQFVPSRDAVNFLSNSSFDKVGAFAESIEQLMICLANAPAIGKAPVHPRKTFLTDKLHQIKIKTGSEYENELAILENAFKLLDEVVGKGAVTAVHGDLTFENILVDRFDKLWLIDSIPSPVDHYWLDWSKLFQECEGLWHAHRGRPLARGVTWWLRERFYKTATRLDASYPLFHYVLLGLTFARILPYARTERDRAFVRHRVAECGRAALRIYK